MTYWMVGLGLLTVLNLIWAYQLSQGRTEVVKLIAHFRGSISESERVRDQACQLFETAKKTVATANLEHDYQVCNECDRIVTRHSKDSGRLLCVNCAADLATKVADLATKVQVNG